MVEVDILLVVLCLEMSLPPGISLSATDENIASSYALTVNIPETNNWHYTSIKGESFYCNIPQHINTVEALKSRVHNTMFFSVTHEK